MKIGAIFTGGTIGSVIGSDGYISVDKSERYVLLDMYYEKYDTAHETEFLVRSPYTILSENLRFDNIYKLKSAIDELKNSVDAIVIMHGTDTLQYTAGFLNYMVVTNIPIVLVSSAYVLDDPKANGLENLALAIEFSRLKKAGVFVSYVNSDGRKLIHAADKLLAHNTFSSDLYSINSEHYAEMISFGNDMSKQCVEGEKADNYRIVINEKCRYIKNELNIDIINCKVLFIHAYPGMSGAIDVSQADAVLIESYHSGTAPVTNALAELMENAAAGNIPVYLVGIKSEGSQYDTVREYEAMGINVIYDEAPIAAYCRLSCGR